MAKRLLPVPERSSAYLNRISLEYARYILDYRGIPAMTDGLKNAQRIALFLMMTTPGKMKTSAFAGEMVKSELYIHGGASAEDTLSRLAAPYLNNRPLLYGDGAFGTRSNPAQFSAARYTHVLRDKFTEKVLYVDADIAPQMENYDGSRLMPATFLPLIPTVLLNGITGIAIGWATRIFPRSFEDLRAATLEYVKTGKISARLYPKYEKFDVKVTKGDGPGKYVVSGKFERINDHHIRIIEIPLEKQNSINTLEAYRQMLIEYEEWGLITDFDDQSKDYISIDVKLATPGSEVRETRTKKDGKTTTKTYPVPKWTDDTIYDVFDLRYRLSERLVMLGPPDKPGVRLYETPHEIIQDFVEWRLGWYKIRYERLADIERDKNLFYRCLMAVYDAEVPKILTEIKNKSEFKDAISLAIKDQKLEVREDIVERLAVLPGYRWTIEGRQEAKKDADESKKAADEYTAIAKSPQKQKKIYETELEQISK